MSSTLMDILNIKGETTYLDGKDPALSIAIDDKVSCRVAIKDIEQLDVKENEKDALAWSPLKRQYSLKVPQDTREARFSLMPGEYREGVKKLCSTDKKFEYLYFGGDDYDGTRMENLTAVMVKLADCGYDEEACHAVSKTSAWNGGSPEVEKSMARTAVKCHEKEIAEKRIEAVERAAKVTEKAQRKAEELKGK